MNTYTPNFVLDGSVLHLFFYYLMNLNIITVKTKVMALSDLTGTISAEWVLFSGNKSKFMFVSFLLGGGGVKLTG